MADKYEKKRHAVYLCTYHMVFVTKYRKPLIDDHIADFLKKTITRLAERMNGAVLSAETDKDHIHLIVSLPPDISAKYAVVSFKTQTSKLIHQDETCMEQVRKYLFGDCPFWQSSYFVATTGSVSMDIVKKYIEEQRTDAHKRKYEHSGKFKKKHRARKQGINSSASH